MLACEMECSRKLLIKLVIIAGSWTKIDVLEGNLLVRAKMNVIISTWFYRFVLMLVLVWCRCGLCALCLYIRNILLLKINCN